MAERRLRIGLVGAGMVATHHIAGWAATPAADIVAVADPDRRRAAARAAEIPGARACAGLADMLCDDLDAVDIVAPPHLHAALVAEAAAAGLDVICQKPLAPTLREARAIVASLPPSRRLMVHENWRRRAPYVAFAAALGGGAIGTPRSFELEVVSSGLLSGADGRRPALVRQPFFAGLDRFLVIEVLIHHLDTLASLFGPVEIVAARLENRSGAIDAEDTATIDLRAGDVRGRLFAGFAVSGAPPLPTDRLAVQGAGGTALVDGWSLALPGGPRRSWNSALAYQASYTDTIRAFAGALRSGAPFDTGPEAALAALAAVEAVYAAAGR